MRLGDNMEDIKLKNEINRFKEYSKKLVIDLIKYVITFLVFISFFVFLYFLKKRDSSDKVVLVFYYITLTFSILIFLGFFIELYYYLKERSDYLKILENEKDKDNYSIFHFEDENLIVTSYENGEEKGNSKMTYSSFDHYRVTKSYVLLYYRKYDCWPLDKVDGLEDFFISKGIKKKNI